MHERPACPPPTRILQSLESVADRYDGFIVDQWGVLHDGQSAFPGAVNCLHRLAELGKQTIILSNSGKRNSASESRLSALGFARNCYSELVTSGDVTWHALGDKKEPFFAGLGPRCLLFSNDGDRSIVAGLESIELASDVVQADFILLAGPGAQDRMVDWEPLLHDAIARRLPMICANPDLARFVKGEVVPSSGAIARRYEHLGGSVRYVGKPFPEVYEWCRRLFDQKEVRRILAVGDSLVHDILGGSRAGFDTLFIEHGIHRDDFAAAADDAGRLVKLAELASDEGEWPVWMLSSFRW